MYNNGKDTEKTFGNKFNEKQGEEKMKKEIVSKLNELAQEDFEKAKAMLDGINMVLGTKLGWLNKRVVFFDEYRNAHDAWVYAE